MLIALKCRVFSSTGWILVTFVPSRDFLSLFLYLRKLFEKRTYHNSHFLVLSCLVRLVSVCPCLSFICNYHFLTFAICSPCPPWPSFPCFWLRCHYDVLNMEKITKKKSWWIILTFILNFFDFVFFSHHSTHDVKWSNHFGSVKQRATRNLAVSVTYQECRAHRCGSHPSLAHPLKAMRLPDRCAAVAPPSLPSCSRGAGSPLGRCRGLGSQKHWRGLIAASFSLPHLPFFLKKKKNCAPSKTKDKQINKNNSNNKKYIWQKKEIECSEARPFVLWLQWFKMHVSG